MLLLGVYVGTLTFSSLHLCLFGCAYASGVQGSMYPEYIGYMDRWGCEQPGICYM